MKTAIKVKRKRRLMVRRKRSLDPSILIDYKRPEVLKRFITDRGKIIPRRISGATAEQQRMITQSVKRARFLSLLPSTVAHRSEKGFAGDMSAAAAMVSGRGREGGGYHSRRDHGGEGGGRSFSDNREPREPREHREPREPRSSGEGE